VPLCAAPADPWLRMRTANFELFTDAGERAGRDILNQFERVHSFFEQAYGNQKGNAKPVCLIAFRSVKEYQPYSPSAVAAAYFQPGNERDYIVMTAGVTDNSRLPVHEYTHLMIHQSGQRIPLWMNEGTAELYSTMEPRGPKVLVGDVIPSHLMALGRDRWIGLAALLNADHSSQFYNEKIHAGIFYSECWLLVHMLNLDPAYRPRLREFMAALPENGAAAAFQQAYGKSLDAVDADLHQYFRRKSVNGLLFPVQLPKSADDPEVETGAAFGIRLALAGLVEDTPNQRDQARAAYFGLSHDYPDQWEVEAGLAQFYWRERDSAEAVKHYARALELGCKDQNAYIEYGRILGFARREKDAAEILRTAVQLDSTNQRAHYELAVALTGSGDYKAALAEFKFVQRIGQKEAARYSYFLAYALYRDGQLPQARTILERGKPFAALFAALDSRTPGEPPQLTRRETVTYSSGAAATRKTLPSIEGKLTRFDCDAKPLALHLNVNDSDETVVIEDPRNIVIRKGSGAGTPVDFQCGPQNGRRLLIEYQESKDESGKVTRLARILEFR
jgi:tetratricopeptide (TPR) repeat protein